MGSRLSPKQSVGHYPLADHKSRAYRFRPDRSHSTTMPTRTNIKPGQGYDLDSMMENISEKQEALKQKEWKQGKEMESLERKAESLKREMDLLKRPFVMDFTGVKDSILGTVKDNEDPELTSKLIVSMTNMKNEQKHLIQEHSEHEEGRKFLNQKVYVLRQRFEHASGCEGLRLRYYWRQQRPR
jgi:hypothetical protein